MSEQLTSVPTASASRAQASRERPRLLCVDDEPMVLEGLKDSLRRTFDVTTATSGFDGLDILRESPGDIAVVISDMRMPRMSGVDFLQACTRVAPDAQRILLTGQADLEDAIQVVNRARLFRYLTKPCGSRELAQACADAVAERGARLTERDLMENTVRGCVTALSGALALSSPAAFGRASRVSGLASTLARSRGLRNWWEVEVAALLGHLGAAALPEDTAVTWYEGGVLSPEEQAMVDRIPERTRSLVAKIPRMDGVLTILDLHQQRRAPAPDRDDDEAVMGAKILNVVTQYCELEAAGTTVEIALGALAGRGTLLPVLVSELAELLDSTGAQVTEASVTELNAGMVFADDVRSRAGALLVTRGQTATEQLVERLRNLGRAIVVEPLRIVPPPA